MREPPRRYKRLRRRGPQFVRQSHCFARSTCAVVTEPSYRACAACRKVIGDWVFHQGVAPRSESTFDVLLGASTTWSNSLWRSTTACLRHKVRPSREEMASLQLGSCGWARARQGCGGRQRSAAATRAIPCCPCARSSLPRTRWARGGRCNARFVGVRATMKLVARLRRAAEPLRRTTLNYCVGRAAQRRVSTTPRCGSVATTLSSFSCSGANLVQPGTEAARFTSFHLS